MLQLLAKNNCDDLDHRWVALCALLRTGYHLLSCPVDVNLCSYILFAMFYLLFTCHQGLWCRHCRCSAILALETWMGRFQGLLLFSEVTPRTLDQMMPVHHLSNLPLSLGNACSCFVFNEKLKQFSLPLSGQ